ncbi:MAG: SurA N-terminal domain-containing protein [Thiobacillus sp.]|nr:SurA N-terminal domain-containing protein [Thiobacillus sp.]
MLEAIRKHAQGWLAKVILGLIAVTFALFGLDTYMQGDRTGGAIAKVGEMDISRDALAEAVRTQTDRMREAMGPAFDPAVAETRDFRQQVLDSMTERLALLQEAQKLKLAAPDSHLAMTLAQIPAFQQDGKFSRERYEAVLKQNGRTPSQFETELRQAFMLETMTSPATLASFPSREMLAGLVRLVAQQREIAWVDLPASSVAAEIKVTPADIERYYQANKPAFTEPEQIQAEYVVLDLATVASGIAVTEQQIDEYYRTQAAQFAQPEQRAASHILIAVDKSAAPAVRAKAKAEAESLYQILQKTPARFAELAREKSQDPGSAEQGGSLGSFGRGMMVKPFEDAVFAMKPGEIRGPVESDFGYHIIRLDGIQAGQTVPLAQVRADIVEALRRQMAQKRFADMAETFGNLVYENAGSLQAAADAVKSPILKSGWMSVKVPPPPFDNKALSQALFSADSIKSRQNTEAMEIRPGTLVAARVTDYRAARLKPLAEVAPLIESRLRAEQSVALLVGKGKALMEALDKGNEPALNWSGFSVVGRQPGEILDPVGAKAVFRTRTDKLPAYTGFMRPDGSYRLVRITRVIDAASPDPMLASSIESGVLQAQQRADLQAMAGLAKAAQKVEIKANAVEGR